MTFPGKIEMTSLEGKQFAKSIPSLRAKWKEECQETQLFSDFEL